MLPDRVSNPEPLTYESGALPIALRGPAIAVSTSLKKLSTLHCEWSEFPDGEETGGSFCSGVAYGLSWAHCL